MCERCREDYRERNDRMDRVVSYADIYPSIQFYGNDSNLHLGVELELEWLGSNTAKEDFQPIVDVFNNRAVLKTDGTVVDGIEIAAHPATLEYHRKGFDWQEIMETLRNSNFEAASSCGLHIHASRKGITDDGLQRLVTFVYSKTNYNLIKHLARRESRW